MKGNLTKKDFIAYLAKGGNVNFDKAIKLNKAQLAKLSKDQKDGQEPVYIEDKKGYIDGNGFWEPTSRSKNALGEQLTS